MKISEIFNLNKTQHELDFVDIDPETDKRVFLDPFFISTRKSPWCEEVTRTIKVYFQLVIDYIKLGEIDKARELFINLNEPNGTCLGFSKGNPAGRGVGPENANDIFESLVKSKAVESGIVEDLEDTAIFIDGISKDKVSDMTTNIIKLHLLEYTKLQCNLWNIPLVSSVPSGFYWDATTKSWDTDFFDRLVINNKPILLVPKIAVSFYKEYIDQKYYQHYVLNYLQQEHLANNSRLVRIRKFKNGQIKKYVTKNDIQENDAPFSKEFIREFAKNHPDTFKNFRDTKSKTSAAIKNDDLEDINIKEVTDFLIEKLQNTPVGNKSAHDYHMLMIGILELIFYPNLVSPIKEKEINDGRKRIDISFDNAASRGFFYNMHMIHKIISRYIFVECKNYSDDPTNPELDQLSNRFSINNTMVGFLVCRIINDKQLMKNRCIDLWKQKHELTIALCDEDIVFLLKEIGNGILGPEESLLNDKQREIIVS